jgi:hypothetical protein
MNLKTVLAALIVAVSGGAKDCWAWGATGHEWISGIAIEKLPETIPDFVRTPEAVAEIVVLSRELDRSKGAGKPHDAERDAGHYIDLDDNGSVMGKLPLDELPPTREDYDSLRRVGAKFRVAKAGKVYGVPEGAITSLGFVNQLSSAVSNRYVTFGHAFAYGHVPAGKQLVAKVGSQEILLQVDKKTTHGDGSLKFAVVTAKLDSLGGGQSLQSGLFTVSSAPVGATLTPSDVLRIANYDFVVNITMGGQTYSASARAALQAAVTSGNVETYLSGPFVTEFNVRSNLTANLDAEFDIRIYANNEIRTEVTVTNSYGFVSGMADRTYDVTLTQAGQVVYSRAGLKHVPYSNWHRNFVSGGSAMNVFIKHNRAYYAQTRLVPNFNPDGAPTEAYIQSRRVDLNSASCGPMGTGTLTPYMPTTGLRDDIGFLPVWDAVYFTSMDVRARDWVLCNANAAASIPYHVAETSGLPFRVTDHPSLWLDYRGQSNANKLASAFATGSSPFTPETAHMPSLGYSAYLITGDRVYLQETLFQVGAVIGMTWNSPRQNGKGIIVSDAEEARAAAWNLRTLANAAEITPDSHSQKAYLMTLLDNNLTYLNNHFTGAPAQAQGEIHGYLYGPHRKGLAPWQQDFLAISLGQIANRGYAKAISAIKGQANFIAGRYIQAESVFCPTLAAANSLTVARSNGSFAQTWAEVRDLNFGSSCPASIDTAGGDFALHSTPALAPMVDQGVAMAQQALNLWKQKDPNWNPSQPNGAYFYPRQMTEHISWSIVPFKK